MQLTHFVKTLPSPDLAKHHAELLLSCVGVTEVAKQVGSMMLALGCLLLCFLVVFPCMFLMTVGAQSLLWLLERP